MWSVLPLYSYQSHVIIRKPHFNKICPALIFTRHHSILLFTTGFNSEFTFDNYSPIRPSHECYLPVLTVYIFLAVSNLKLISWHLLNSMIFKIFLKLWILLKWHYKEGLICHFINSMYSKHNVRFVMWGSRSRERCFFVLYRMFLSCHSHR